VPVWPVLKDKEKENYLRILRAASNPNTRLFSTYTAEGVASFIVSYSKPIHDDRDPLTIEGINFNMYVPTGRTRHDAYVGHAHISIMKYEDPTLERKSCRLDYIYIDPSNRKEHFGSVLIIEILRFMKYCELDFEETFYPNDVISTDLEVARHFLSKYFSFVRIDDHGLTIRDPLLIACEVKSTG
jgi:hypothetical protein